MIPPHARAVPDVVGPGLRVLFVGINPGLVSGATGHHFARPGNRFWPTLHGAGLTPRLFRPDEDRLLLDLGLGITNIVARTTATAAELADDELRAGAERLRELLARIRPRVVAFVGVGAYRTAFDRPQAPMGPQPERIEGCAVWVLPNPSGLNAHYQLPQLIEAYRPLARASALDFSELVAKATTSSENCPVPDDDNAWENALIADMATHGGRPTSGPLKGHPLMVVMTTGAKSGQPRRSILTYSRDGDDYVVAGTKGGAPTDPLWVENMRVHPEVSIQIGDQSFTAIAQAAAGAERDRLWDNHVAELPWFGPYPAKTDRLIPMIRLTPSAAGT